MSRRFPAAGGREGKAAARRSDRARLCEGDPDTAARRDDTTTVKDPGRLASTDDWSASSLRG